MIFSKENGLQYEHCINALIKDQATRNGTMIYNRPSMHTDAYANNMHDFCCTFSVQCFLNENTDGTFDLNYIVYQRSCDAVFGFNNDLYWHKYVQNKMVEDLSKLLNTTINKIPILYHCGSLHVYERHFKYLKD
jgi:thymidylate synthase